MIGHLSRLLPTLVPALAARTPQFVSTLHRRVSLRQIDVNLHMNQGAYLEVFEWGRMDWFLRSGALRRWRAVGLKPLVAEQRVVYRRELKPWARYELDSRAVAVEGRLLRFEHHLLVGDRVHALGEVKLLFVGPDGVLAPSAAEHACSDLLAPAVSVRDWLRQTGTPR